MDSVTQFLLGASISGALLGPRIGAKSLLIGGLVATLPDLDSLVPYDDPIDRMTHHRGFSHSLIVQTMVTPVITLAIHKIVPSVRPHIKTLLLTVWLALVTHSLLDALTTYGTQLFWPFQFAPPAAFPAVFIIDPVYSLLLLAGVLAILFMRRRPGGGFRVNGVMLALSLVYLGIGAAGHVIVSQRASEDPLLRGMRLHVQPAAFTLFIWQVTGISEDRMVSGLMNLAGDCSLRHVVEAPRHPRPLLLAEAPPSVRRLEWFTDGFYSYGMVDGAETITDLRLGFHPDYVFTFRIAEMQGGQVVALRPERIRRSYGERAGEMLAMIRGMTGSCTTEEPRATAFRQETN